MLALEHGMVGLTELIYHMKVGPDGKMLAFLRFLACVSGAAEQGQRVLSVAALQR